MREHAGMAHQAASPPKRSRCGAHLALGVVLIAGGAVAAFVPAGRTVVWVASAASLAAHLGLALVAFLGFRLLGAGHARGRNPRSQGRTIRWAALYDVLVQVLALGGERALREAMLERARISPGERVLDVGCGTGTLALAARRRVGAAGTVHGVDAAAEMVARAQQKAARAGLAAAFDVAPADALPFPHGAFDAVLCTLVVHHLPAGLRPRAIAEMRRVLRPGGRLLVVDFARKDGWWTALNPVRLLHGHGAMHAAAEAETLMREAGFEAITSGRLGAGVLGYALGTADGGHG